MNAKFAVIGEAQSFFGNFMQTGAALGLIVFVGFLLCGFAFRVTDKNIPDKYR